MVTLYLIERGTLFIVSDGEKIFSAVAKLDVLLHYGDSGGKIKELLSQLRIDFINGDVANVFNAIKIMQENEKKLFSI